MRTRAVVACGRSIAVPAAHDVARDQVRDHRFACRARRERRWKLGRIHLQCHGVPDHEHRSRRGGERAVAKTEQLTADTRGLVFALELRPGGCVVRRLPHRQHKRVPAQSVGAREHIVRLRRGHRRRGRQRQDRSDVVTDLGIADHPRRLRQHGGIHRGRDAKRAPLRRRGRRHGACCSRRAPRARRGGAASGDTKHRHHYKPKYRAPALAPISSQNPPRSLSAHRPPGVRAPRPMAGTARRRVAGGLAPRTDSGG